MVAALMSVNLAGGNDASQCTAQQGELLEVAFGNRFSTAMEVRLTSDARLVSLRSRHLASDT